MKRKTIKIDTRTLEDMGGRLLAAWKQIEKGYVPGPDKRYNITLLTAENIGKKKKK